MRGVWEGWAYIDRNGIPGSTGSATATMSAQVSLWGFVFRS